MKKEIIDKLPPDAQKEFLKLAMKLDEKTKQEKDEILKKDFKFGQLVYAALYGILLISLIVMAYS